MTTYVLRDGHLIEKHLAQPMNAARSAPHVISDTMAPLKHQGTGAMIDSKAEFRRHTRMAGCVEVGTDPAGSQARPSFDVSTAEIAMDVKRSIEQLRSR